MLSCGRRLSVVETLSTGPHRQYEGPFKGPTYGASVRAPEFPMGSLRDVFQVSHNFPWLPTIACPDAPKIPRPEFRFRLTRRFRFPFSPLRANSNPRDERRIVRLPARVRGEQDAAAGASGGGLLEVQPASRFERSRCDSIGC